MKEIMRAGEKVMLSIPEEWRDRATVLGAGLFLHLGKDHTLRTPRARRTGVKLLNRWVKGLPTPLSEYAEGILEGYKFQFAGFEELPHDGPEILVVNQTNEGPMRGNWLKFLVNYCVAKRRCRGGNFEGKWVQKEGSSRPLLANTPLDIQRRRLGRMINKSCGTILIDETQTDREKFIAVLAMKHHLSEGGVLIVCPEGVDSPVLKWGQEEAGQLVSMLAVKLDVPVRPVGVWYSKNNLHVNFGDVFKPEVNEGQRVADMIMIEIGKLLPEEKRGVYRRVIGAGNGREA